MQPSIPNPALLPRAGPYSHAIVGYGIRWNHPAECTTPARGSCRPSPGICLRSSSFRAFPESGIASGASSIFGTGRELCFVMDCQALMVLKPELEILPRERWLQPLEASAKPNQRNMTYVLSVKRISRLAPPGRRESAKISSRRPYTSEVSSRFRYYLDVSQMLHLTQRLRCEPLH